MRFFRRIQHRNTATSFFNTHTHKHSHAHTHTHDWPTVASRSSGSRGVFSGFAKSFWTTRGQQEFLDRQGVMQHTKILSSES